MSSPIDILMATFNGEKYLREQITSVQAQSVSNWRLLISDDCSSDDTLNILEEFVRADHRIKIVSKGKRYGGAKENFYALMRCSNAPYIMFCDQDDVWRPNKIEVTFSAIETLERRVGVDKPCLVFTDMNVVDSNLNLMAPSFIKLARIDPKRTSLGNLLAKPVGAGCSMMFNASCLKMAVLPADLPEGVIMHDWWLSLVAAAFGGIGYIDITTSDYRQHEANVMGAKSASLKSLLIDFDAKRRMFREAIDQAGAFRDCYYQYLDDSAKERLDAFCDIRKEQGVSVIPLLLKSGSARKNLHFLYQVITVLTLKRREKRGLGKK